MCTAISFKTKDHYFGRNLDLEFSYHETVTITPRAYPFKFSNNKSFASHYAMIGMAFVQNDYPLYYDATNEKGLSMAGLNFPGNAYYEKNSLTKDNIATFEFIPWVLSQCSTVAEAKSLLENTNLVGLAFTEELKATPLHYIISDRNKSITVEPLKDGLKIYDNLVGVLTNNPPFDFQLLNLAKYTRIRAL